MNYFEQYSSRELAIVALWIDSIPGLRDITKGISPDNTGYHDCFVVFNNGFRNLIIEVKEDEEYWYNRTGNVGFDYISAFTYKNKEVQSFAQESKLWIKPDKLEYFLNNINIDKWGKLKTCDADIQLFYVEDKTTHKIKFIKAYPNQDLQNYRPEIEKNLSMRINYKNAYASRTDTWESSAYYINPLTDSYLKKIEINSIDDLENVLT